MMTAQAPGDPSRRGGIRAFVRALPILLCAALAVKTMAVVPYAKVDPDVGHYSRGAKHWALYGTYGFEDLSTEFITPVHAWLLSAMFAAFGPSYELIVRIGQAEILVAAFFLLLLFRREGRVAACAAFLLLWTDYAIAYCVRSGGVEPTQVAGVAAMAILLSSREAGLLRWGAAGFGLSLAVFAKPTAVIFASAVLWRASGDGGRMIVRRLSAFALGALPVALATALFFLAHYESASKAWTYLIRVGGDHDRPPWASAGVWLFHWGNTGWRHTLAPLHLLSLAMAAPLLFGGKTGKDDKLRWLAILSWIGLLSLVVYPPMGRRYVLVAFPLACLSGTLLADPSRWSSVADWYDRPARRILLCAWLLLALTPLLSYVKEPLSAWLHLRYGKETGWTQSTAGYLLLAVSIPLSLAAVWGAGRLSGAGRSSQSILLSGGGLLAASFLLVRLHGFLGSMLGHVPHMEGPPRGVERDVVARACLVAGLSALLGVALVALAWRFLARKEGSASPPSKPPLYLLALAFTVWGLFLPLWREAHTHRAPSEFRKVSAELASRIRPDSTIYGGQYADITLLSAPCRVVTPWIWHHYDVELFLRNLLRYRWNLPISRFRPDYLLLEDEKEVPDVLQLWGPLLEGISREPMGEWTLDKHRLRLYRLRWEEGK